MQRRKFLKSSGLFTAGFYCLRLPAIAGPFHPSEFKGGVAPADKHLNPGWISSIMERGQPTLYRKSKDELKYIGMPVGGITTGTVYLGGDGRLWLWDVFNRNPQGIIPKTLEFEGEKIGSTSGAAYVQPNLPNSPFYQEFVIKVSDGNNTISRSLKAEDFTEVIFAGTYPIGTVTYEADDLPVSVVLEVYSPFIPLQEDDSGIPVTILSFNIKNKTDRRLEVVVGGVLENASLLHKDEGGRRINKRIQVDNASGVLCSFEPSDEKFSKMPEYGTMCIAALGTDTKSFVNLDAEECPEILFKSGPGDAVAAVPAKNLLIGGVRKKIDLGPGAMANCNFFISWHFPFTELKVKDAAEGNYYTRRFKDASDVVRYVALDFERLSSLTHAWRDTWYDSSLPYWFLDRSFANITTLATSTSHRFGTGRFWGWEGVGCCEGTCTHVWQYAQAMSRIFPSLERDTRERVDLNLAFDQKTGMIGYRGEGTGAAIDGQAGTILRIYREHQMSADHSFLQRNWARIRKAIQYLLDHDSNNDGLVDGSQPNTLDAAWFGEIAWISSLCLAAWRAGEEMAREMGDITFATLCKERFAIGKKNLENQLFNGEFFIQLPDPSLPKRPLGSYKTCEIDQVFGQSWAWQVGLGRILEKQKTMSALGALWKYNYTPDVGPYIRDHKGGRPYALAGEGGMLMDTNPHHATDPFGDDISWQVGYFNECMTGFEHQVASHMIAEGMVKEGLVITRTIHDRYHAARRNPYNEIECSDHYARAMASYGSFINICGFTCHGPKGFIGFAPKLSPEEFRSAFTTAESWGSYSQRRDRGQFSAKLEVKYGKLKVKKICVEPDINHKVRSATVMLNNRRLSCTITQYETVCEILLDDSETIYNGQYLTVNL
ncbi:hypothetical protein FW778_22700 [Ginsengibacter hankyongi]|uniref:Beta-Glucocerebrosidase 2 N terminal n=1 Tax=Ginsengibacter hankyongi TaxID=2607284 RepID=A0A5J5IEN4_9BACT|nr:GH116 family glycosyl-hydrolase [Ginsengibacter hankyongi]KAA9034379.1 hypothetical protein FW778_22700 [Ginsengibacter hankyongi]